MEELIDLILEYVEPDDEITADSDLRSDCGITSFDMMCLTQELCKRKNVKLGFDDVRACATVRDLFTLCGGAE